MGSLKQNLEDGEVASFAWIAGTKIVADVFTKQGSQRAALEEIVLDNTFRHSQTTDNLVVFEDDEIKIKNLTMKAGKKSVTSHKHRNGLCTAGFKGEKNKSASGAMTRHGRY